MEEQTKRQILASGDAYNQSLGLDDNGNEMPDRTNEFLDEDEEHKTDNPMGFTSSSRGNQKKEDECLRKILTEEYRMMCQRATEQFIMPGGDNNLAILKKRAQSVNENMQITEISLLMDNSRTDQTNCDTSFDADNSPLLLSDNCK